MRHVYRKFKSADSKTLATGQWRRSKQRSLVCKLQKSRITTLNPLALAKGRRPGHVRAVRIHPLPAVLSTVVILLGGIHHILLTLYRALEFWLVKGHRFLEHQRTQCTLLSICFPATNVLSEEAIKQNAAALTTCDDCVFTKKKGFSVFYFFFNKFLHMADSSIVKNSSRGDLLTLISKFSHWLPWVSHLDAQPLI